MLFTQIIFFILYFKVTAEAQTATDSTSTEDLIDAYYTLTPTETDQFTQQDELDAQTIWDSGKNESVIATILPYREKIRRYGISQKILDKISGFRNKKHQWITHFYYPQMERNTAFADLCFGLIQDENVVLSAYLANFFDHKDETWTIIGMVLVKQMQTMVEMTYNNLQYNRIKVLRKEQRHPFENMLRRWVRQNREPIEKEPLNQDSITQDANALKTEQQNGGWHKKRHQIEVILMWKSIKYARAVIERFEKDNGGKPIEDIITENVQISKLNHDLADAYASLARYIKDKYSYIADIMHRYCDGSDRWAAWIMCIAVIHPKEWPLVDAAFRKINNNESLSQTIVKKLSDYMVLAETMAVIVDPEFKPTTFKEKPIQNGSIPPTVSGVGPPPPVPQTAMASSNDPTV